MRQIAAGENNKKQQTFDVWILICSKLRPNTESKKEYLKRLREFEIDPNIKDEINL